MASMEYEGVAAGADASRVHRIEASMVGTVERSARRALVPNREGSARDGGARRREGLPERERVLGRTGRPEALEPRDRLLETRPGSRGHPPEDDERLAHALQPLGPPPHDRRMRGPVDAAAARTALAPQR